MVVRIDAVARVSVLFVAFLIVVSIAGCAGRTVAPVSVSPTPSTASPSSPQAPAAQTGEKGVYLVRAVWQDAPLSKARIEWRIDPSGPPVLTGTTIRFGTAQFRPQDGSYFVSAEWRSDGDYERPRRPGDRVGYLPVNPISFSSGSIGEVSLILEELASVPLPPATSSPPGVSGVFGRVTNGGKGLANITVFAYPKADTGFRGNDFKASVKTDKDGLFLMDLPPGKYYLLARQRSDSGVAGPLKKGDFIGFEPGNPVIVDEGRLASSSIPATQLRMIKSSHEATASKGTAVVEGRVVDKGGKPVVGVYAALYPKDAGVTGRPIFQSESSDVEGRFVLPVPVPGTYLLGARTGHGGVPADGTPFGSYGGTPDHSISLKSGERRTGIEIVVAPVRPGQFPAPK